MSLHFREIHNVLLLMNLYCYSPQLSYAFLFVCLFFPQIGHVFSSMFLSDFDWR